MSLWSNFGKRRPKPITWDTERSYDRSSYRIYSTRLKKNGPGAGFWIASLLLVLVAAGGFLVYNQLNPIFPFLTISGWNNPSSSNPTAASSADATPISAAVTPLTTAPAYTISPIEAEESWGIITANRGLVFLEPDSDNSKIAQELSRWTIVAFEAKSNHGWYMLLGGGWVQASQVKAFPSELKATAAVNESRAQATQNSGPLVSPATTSPASSPSH